MLQIQSGKSPSMVADKMNNKPPKQNESIEALSELGCAALEAQWGLSDDQADDAAWNLNARISRSALRKLATIRAKTVKEALAKAKLLAMATESQGKADQRFALAESILDDIETFVRKS